MLNEFNIKKEGFIRNQRRNSIIRTYYIHIKNILNFGDNSMWGLGIRDEGY